MGDSFCVDVAALGRIPSMLDGAHALLASTHASTEATVAAAAAAPGCGGGIARFGAALDAFVAAGTTAIGDDIESLQRNATAYQACELGVERAATTLGRRLGTGR